MHHSKTQSDIFKVHDSSRRWVTKRRHDSGLSSEERFLITSLSHDVEAEPLGLGCTFFTITFAFLGSVSSKIANFQCKFTDYQFGSLFLQMMGLVVTYGVLVYQVSK